VLHFSHEVHLLKILFLEFVEHLVGDGNDFGDSFLDMVKAVKRVGELSVGLPLVSVDKEGTVSEDHFSNITSSGSLDVALFLGHVESLDEFRVFQSNNGSGTKVASKSSGLGVHVVELFPGIENIFVFLDTFSKALEETPERSKDDRESLLFVVSKLGLGLHEEPVVLVDNKQDETINWEG